MGNCQRLAESGSIEGGFRVSLIERWELGVGERALRDQMH